MRGFLVFSLFTVALAAPSRADVTVRFIEGAPKDRFEILSVEGCGSAPLSLTIDLQGSAGALVFDVTDAGAGVEVFQPFELVAGGELVVASTDLTDGDKELTLDLSGLGPGAVVGFTIDVDDTIGAREITVSDAEIEGAEVRVSSDIGRAAAQFGGDATAVLPTTACGA